MVGWHYWAHALAIVLCKIYHSRKNSTSRNMNLLRRTRIIVQSQHWQRWSVDRSHRNKPIACRFRHMKSVWHRGNSLRIRHRSEHVQLTLSCCCCWCMHCICVFYCYVFSSEREYSRNSRSQRSRIRAESLMPQSSCKRDTSYILDTRLYAACVN